MTLNSLSSCLYLWSTGIQVRVTPCSLSGAESETWGLRKAGQALCITRPSSLSWGRVLLSCSVGFFLINKMFIYSVMYIYVCARKSRSTIWGPGGIGPYGALGSGGIELKLLTLVVSTSPHWAIVLAPIIVLKCVLNCISFKCSGSEWNAMAKVTVVQWWTMKGAFSWADGELQTGPCSQASN